jgi:acetyl-CoA acetyltransferase
MTLDGLKGMRELDTCVTSGTQTHASDGMATLLVTSLEKARELSPQPEIDIQFVSKAELRTLPTLMPEAPALTVQKLLEHSGLTMDDMVVVKNHNPFAVNDVIFARLLDYDWRKMNNTGCPLVWGHPQGPTLTRVLIEALEEAVELGGGYVLVFGCAAGDVGIAAILKVTEGGNR